MTNFFSKLLGWADVFSPTNLGYWDPPADKQPDGFVSYAIRYKWVGEVFGPISIALYVIMGLVGAAGAIYAIYAGIQLARADDQSKRDEAKKHLITILIAVAVTIVLVIFFNEILPMIVQAMARPKTVIDNTPKAAGAIVSAIKSLF